MKISFLLYFFIFCITLISCRLNDVDDNYNIKAGYEYNPLKVGKYLTYKIDSIIYDNENNQTIKIGKTRFVKEVIADTFRNEINELIYRIERFDKLNESDPWELKNVWTAYLSNFQLIRTEDNFRFIKLAFPIRKGKSWDGNAFIDPTSIIKIADESVEVYKNWDYSYLSIDKPEIVNGIRYDSVAVVSQVDDQDNLIELRYSREKYAKNIGLVSKEMKILDTQKITSKEPWENKAEKGFIMVQNLIDHN